MFKKCGDCRNLEALKKYGRYVLVCAITNHECGMQDKVICSYYKAKI